MSKILIFYGSTSGNTQGVAEKINRALKEVGHNVTLKNVIDTKINELNNYEVLLPGSSTWNEGELQDDFLEFHMQFEENPPQLSGKKFAVFGCGESVYEFFCQAVDILEKTFKEAGAERLVESLKIDGYPEDDENIAKLNKWIENLKKTLP